MSILYIVGGTMMNYLNEICKIALEGIDKNREIYTEDKLIEALNNIIRPNMTNEEIRDSVMQIALELTSDMEPDWQFAASKLFVLKLYDNIKEKRGILEEKNLYNNLYEFISELTEKGLYGRYILENYTKEEILELEKEIKSERDFIMY